MERKTGKKTAAKTTAKPKAQAKPKTVKAAAPKKTKAETVPQKESENPKIKTVSAAGLAKFVNVTERRIQQWAQEDVVKKVGRGNYDFLVSVHGIIEFYQKIAESRKGVESEKMADAKLRREKAKQTLDEIKVQKTLGELHHKGDIINILGPIFMRIHTGIDSLPLGIAPLITNEPDAMVIAMKIKDQQDRVLYEITHFDFESFLKTESVADYYKSLRETDGKPEPAE